MTDINRLLRDADPVEREDGLSSDDALAIRREMLGAIADPPMAVPVWRRPLAVAAAAALILGISGIAHRSSSTKTEPAVPEDPAMASGSAGEMPRQLQFATPGGTRIIWIFDQNLRLQESMP